MQANLLAGHLRVRCSVRTKYPNEFVRRPLAHTRITQYAYRRFSPMFFSNLHMFWKCHCPVGRWVRKSEERDWRVGEKQQNAKFIQSIRFWLRAWLNALNFVVSMILILNRTSHNHKHTSMKRGNDRRPPSSNWLVVLWTLNGISLLKRFGCRMCNNCYYERHSRWCIK